MTDEPVQSEPLSARLGLFGKLDTALYRAEVVTVVTALVLMSAMVFTDVVYQLAVSISQYVAKGDARGMSIAAPLLGFIGLMAFAATGDNRPFAERTGESLARPLPIRIGAAIGTAVGCAVFAWALLHLESSTVYRLVTIAGCIPIARAFWQHGSKQALGAFVAAALIAVAIFGSLPTGYSWSQSYSLILLLWVSFLGASIAARERRHLRVDLARKLISPAKLPWFNAVSYLVAAGFTAIVLYLGFTYMFGPDSTYLRPIWDPPGWLPESTRTMLVDDFPLPPDASVFRRALQVFFMPGEPGELPDWLKVAAIPVSMLFICVRFLGHAVVFIGLGMRGEEFHEETGAH